MDACAYVESRAAEFIDELKQWLASPSISADRIHAPNEKVELCLLLRGAEASAYLWDELAAVAPDLK